MLYHKITEGYVVQIFNDVGEFVEQQFIAGEVEYETSHGNPIHEMDMPLCGDEHHPFDMK